MKFYHIYLDLNKFSKRKMKSVKIGADGSDSLPQTFVRLTGHPPSGIPHIACLTLEIECRISMTHVHYLILHDSTLLTKCKNKIESEKSSNEEVASFTRRVISRIPSNSDSDDEESYASEDLEEMLKELAIAEEEELNNDANMINSTSCTSFNILDLSRVRFSDLVTKTPNGPAIPIKGIIEHWFPVAQ
ncbi:hypothetical protein WN51_08634 [Melipona quadrifasciata]|uniref:Uncharacterized protein n=1 Tax=Melipona quadrifasciata TaxID=166423 RepID=A0A0M9A7L0_9HYME|nr:hypothetical protein WN51_08634 [Melipona quadrifasciata]